MTSRLPPAARRELIRFLSERGWDGPRSGGSHDYMIKATHRQVIPSDREISAPFLLRLLKQAGYTRRDWLNR
ncbi:type II toxin-antitoxin system HicA family toxin [Candidatus Poriferisodalis sp.]|uniref:type II toxin-antitoxin system HicA family toxin n=1 Tax=Candidatus Poriferisodalis sp. TaxID=3101277 RepID=UPI003B027216